MKMKKWRTENDNNNNMLNKIAGDLSNSMSSMSGSEFDVEEEKQQDFNDLVKKRSSKISGD